MLLQKEEEKNQEKKEPETDSSNKHHKHHHHKHHHKHHKKDETEPSKDEITKSENLPSNITDILSGTSVKVIEVQSIADKNEDISEQDESEVKNEDVHKNVTDVGSKATEETDDGKGNVGDGSLGHGVIEDHKYLSNPGKLGDHHAHDGDGV